MSRVAGSASNDNAMSKKSYFEQQRELQIRDVGVSMEHVLQNVNKLNRSLEGIISIGNEFSSVEALWSHFENVMAKDSDVDIVPHENEAGVKDEEMAASGRSETGMKR